MKRMKSILLILSISLLGVFLILSGMPQGYAYIYLSGTGKIYGNGVGWPGMYAGLGGIYNLYGLGGLYGGIYGGLHNLTPAISGMSILNPMSMIGTYGVGGLYGNIFGLYGLGGLYGLSNPSLLNTPYGLYGLGGLWGMGGIWGGLGGLNTILSTMGLLPTSGLTTSPIETIQPAPIVTAEQAGIWSGNWFSFIKISDLGSMTLNLTEDTATGLLVGEANLLLNNVTNSLPAQVTGVYTGGSTFVLSGGNNTIFTSTFLLVINATLYSIELNCTLTSPTTMTGTYFIQDLVKLVNNDIGSFNLGLSSPVI
ncbi:MAG: hypothetical protein ACMUIM_09165 [bacterium]